MPDDRCIIEWPEIVGIPDPFAPAPPPAPVIDMLPFFEHGESKASLRRIAMPFDELAHRLAAIVPDGPDRTTVLRKLYAARQRAMRTLAFARASRPFDDLAADLVRKLPDNQDTADTLELIHEAKRDAIRAGFRKA